MNPFLLLLLSGFVQAAFGLPVKYFRRWRWEQMWVAQSVTSNVLFPLLWAALLPPEFWRLAARLPGSEWLALYGFGLLWGIGGVGYGLTLTRLGLAFSYSFVFGTTTLTGALLPLLLRMVERPARPALFAAGLVLGLLGIVATGLLQRGGERKSDLPMPLGPPSYGSAVAIAIAAGVFSASYGLAFSYGFPAVRELMEGGIPSAMAPVMVALPMYAGAASVAVPVGLACAVRSGSLGLFYGAGARRNWALALAMGLCGVGGVLLYGYGGSAPGHPSPNVSFGIYMTFFVLAGNAFGVAAGELRGRPRAVVAMWLASTGVLIGAAWLLNVR